MSTVRLVARVTVKSRCSPDGSVLAAFINSLVSDSHQEIYFRGWVDLFYEEKQAKPRILVITNFRVFTIRIAMLGRSVCLPVACVAWGLSAAAFASLQVRQQFPIRDLTSMTAQKDIAGKTKVRIRYHAAVCLTHACPCTRSCSWSLRVWARCRSTRRRRRTWSRSRSRSSSRSRYCACSLALLLVRAWQSCATLPGVALPETRRPVAPRFVRSATASRNSTLRTRPVASYSRSASAGRARSSRALSCRRTCSKISCRQVRACERAASVSQSLLLFAIPALNFLALSFCRARRAGRSARVLPRRVRLRRNCAGSLSTISANRCVAVFRSLLSSSLRHWRVVSIGSSPCHLLPFVGLARCLPF